MKAYVYKSLSWSYENNQLLLKANRLEPNTIEDPEELSFKPSPFFSPVTKLCSIKVCPSKFYMTEPKIGN